MDDSDGDDIWTVTATFPASSIGSQLNNINLGISLLLVLGMVLKIIRIDSWWL